MNRQYPPAIERPLKLYALGQAALLLGAWAMQASGSMLPMAFAASTGLMLTVPLVRHLATARARLRR